MSAYLRTPIRKWGDIALTDKYEYFRDSSTGKCGFKHNGTIVIPARYDDVLDNNGVVGFKNGKAKVKLNGRTFYIDKKGNEVK